MPDDNLKTRAAGRSTARTAIQLIVASIFVGGVFAVLDLSPIDFWRGIFDGVKSVIQAIGESFGEIVVNLATYLLLGAAVVIPIWLLARLLSGGRR